MAKAIKKIGLGKGLEALLPSVEYTKEKGITFKQDSEELSDNGIFGYIEISKIQLNPYQPRRDFEPQALEELKNSIIEHGIITAITVRRSVSGYELISGERRLRAAKDAGLTKIPAYIRDVSSKVEMIEQAMIENLQREDLNPIETAYGYQLLIEECNLTQEDLAVRISKDRSTIANFLRLLRLPEKIQESLRVKEITVGHARALLGLTEIKNMLLAWQEVLSNTLSVRATEQLVKDIESNVLQYDESQKKFVKDKPKKKDPKSDLSNETIAILESTENKLRHLFGTQVRITPKQSNKGTIEIDFYSADDFERLVELFDIIGDAQL